MTIKEIKKVNLPTEEQGLNYFEKYKVPRNIFEHCLRVREVAVFLAQEIEKRGVEVNVHLVNCTALFHDLFKVVGLKELKPNKYHNYVFTSEEIAMWRHLKEKYPNMFEGDVAYHVLKDDYPELAVAVRNASNPRYKEHTWEELIVHYADWRVFRNEIVSLQERLDYLQEAYPRAPALWQVYIEKIKDMEERLFEQLTFFPDEMVEQLGVKNE